MFLCSEPEFEFTKQLQDSDAYEKEDGVMSCEVNDADAKVQWFREDKVHFIKHTNYLLLNILFIL